MSAPTITTIRSGVQFVPAAAASFRRAEARWGRRIDVNSTYRDWDLQMSWYRAWNAYVAGDGPHPGHSRAIHPNLSAHCKGLGLDSDDWTRPGFIKLMAEHGWIRTAAGDPTERHHFEYQWWRDQHRNQLAGNGITPIIEDEGDVVSYLIWNRDDKNENTRRARVDAFSFDVLTAAQATLEGKGLPTVNVNSDEWNVLKAGVQRRIDRFNLNTAGKPALVGAGVDLSQVLTKLAELQTAIAGVNANIDDQPTEFVITPKV